MFSFQKTVEKSRLVADMFASLNIVGSLNLQASLRLRSLSDVAHDVLNAGVVLEAIVR